MPQPAQRITRALISQPWAITEDYLRLMLAIAQRENLDVGAVETQLGRKLENTYTVTERNGVAIIPVIGPIFRYANMFTQISGGTSVQILARDFNAALHNPDVRSILLNIDSPGGEANGIAEFAQMIFAARSQKPITAYVGGMGCSAAYWIASAAGEIVANETAMLGSIGTIVTVEDGNAEGEYTFVSHQSPRKKMNPTTEEGAADIQAIVDTLSEVFVSAVARNRGVSADTVLSDFGKGGIVIGASAVAAGLADTLGSFEGTLAGMANKATGARVVAQANAPQTTPRVSSEPPPIPEGVQGTYMVFNSAPLAAGGLRVDKQPISTEIPHMDENEVVSTPPADVLPPIQAPTFTASDPAVQAQVNAVVQQMTAQFEQQRQIVLEQAQAQFQRQMAEMQAQQQISSYAQNATTATLQRQHALPVEADALTAFLSSLNAAQRTTAQTLFTRILDAGLVSFEEIGSQGDGPTEQSAGEQFHAAVQAKVAGGMSQLSAMQAVGKENPDLYTAYQSESSRRGAVQRKAAK